MRIAVFGTGGAGGYYGARLAQAGEDVTFIARGEHLRSMQQNGLRVDSPKGDFVLPSVSATDDAGSVGKVDLIILGVKAWQVTEAARAMGPLLGPDTVVLPLQNGVETPQQLVAVLGRGHVFGGLAKIFSSLIGPGQIRHVGGPTSVTFGEMDNRRSQRAENLVRVFNRAGVDADVPPDIHVAMWEKLLFIASFGGLGAVTRAPIGVIRTVPETRRMLEEAMGEIYRVGRARNIHFGSDIVERTMAFTDSQPADGTASMQRDIIASRPSELESWNGAVVRLGREVNVATPVHGFIYSSLLPLELRARGRLEFS
ncbi:MAG: 2-dehydropantoate 2-reductase [Deltaproteobacteria bacterium]|nr:2-dehydropantoate 2-reductase [Deltaproteobacteria bacterium]